MTLTKEELIKKHAKTPEQLEAEKAEIEQLSKDRTRQAIDHEKNLLEYFEKTEPIVDPATKKVLAVVRYPSYSELVDLIPPEIKKYRANPEDMPLELMSEIETKYADIEFEIMADLVIDPKKSAQWWKDRQGINRFLKLFNEKLSEMVTLVQKEAVDFPTARKGKK